MESVVGDSVVGELKLESVEAGKCRKKACTEIWSSKASLKLWTSAFLSKAKIQGKMSLDIDVIVKVADKFNTLRASVSDLRTCVIFVIAFVGLMRCDEIIHVTRNSVTIFSDHMTIFCAKCKNDQ